MLTTPRAVVAAAAATASTAPDVTPEQVQLIIAAVQRAVAANLNSEFIQKIRQLLAAADAAAAAAPDDSSAGPAAPHAVQLAPADIDDSSCRQPVVYLDDEEAREEVGRIMQKVVEGERQKFKPIKLEGVVTSERLRMELAKRAAEEKMAEQQQEQQQQEKEKKQPRRGAKKHRRAA
jgi:hypothetical protein